MSLLAEQTASAIHPPLPEKSGERLQWGRCSGAVHELAIARAARQWPGLVVAVARDVQEAARLEQTLGFFLQDRQLPILHFPDWETLPYDVFSPLPELVSQRLLTLHQLQSANKGIIIVPVATLQQRILPPDYLNACSLVLDAGGQLDG